MLQRFLLAFGLVAISVFSTGCCLTPGMCGGGVCGGGACGDVACGKPCGNCGALACQYCGVGSRVHESLASMNCKSGCGEVYWGEWSDNPPKCEPCDCDGNWTGPNDCCSPHSSWLWNGWRYLWGYRYCPYDCDGGCAACDSGYGGYSQPTYVESAQSLKPRAKAAQPKPAAPEVPAIEPSPEADAPALESEGPVTDLGDPSPVKQVAYKRTVPRSQIRK